MLGIAYAGIKPAAFGHVTSRVPLEQRGSAVGLVLSARQLAISSSAIAGGWLAGEIGMRGLFAAGGAGLLGIVLAIGLRDRFVRGLGRREGARLQSAR